MFETSRQLGRIPVVAVRGEHPFEQTAWLKQLLTHPAMQGSVVLSAGVGRDVELGYRRVEPFVLTRPTNAGDCLCCGLNSGLGDALRSLFLRVLTKRSERVDRVVIDAVGLDVEQIALTLKHTPFLGQRYLYQITLAVKGQHAFVGEGAGARDEVLLDFDKKDILKPI